MHVELRGRIGDRPASVVWCNGMLGGSPDVVARAWKLLDEDPTGGASSSLDPTRMLVALVRAFDDVPTAKVAGDTP